MAYRTNDTYMQRNMHVTTHNGSYRYNCLPVAFFSQRDPQEVRIYSTKTMIP